MNPTTQAGDSRRRFLQSGLTGALAVTAPGGVGSATEHFADRNQNGGHDRVSTTVVLDSTPDTYVVFLDMQEVEELILCEQVVNQAQKHPNNPVLGPGDVHDWDGDRAASWAGSLFYDQEEKLFKLWYQGRDIKSSGNMQFVNAIGYAVSEDGVVWHRPTLGLYDYNGRRDNNICFRTPDGMTGHFCVVKDPREPNPERRYQALAEVNLVASDRKTVKHVPYDSPDGLHWKRVGEYVEVPRNGTDTGVIVIDESAPPAERFRAYGQHTCFTGPDIQQLKFVGDVISPSDGAEHEIHFVYTARYRNQYPMIYDYNYHRPYFSRSSRRDSERQAYLQRRMSLERGALPAEEPDRDYQIYVGDIRLASGRDPLGQFQRICPRKPVVPRGERGSWDSGFLSLGGQCFIEHDGEILIFYAGMNERNASGFPGITSGQVATGLATLPRDGFTYLRAADPISRGTMTTRPIQVKNRDAKLSVNVSHTIPWRDWVEVEVLDAQTSQPISGYRREEGRVMQDGTARLVEWRGNFTLAGVEVPEIRLRFHFYGAARLYSFTFAKG